MLNVSLGAKVIFRSECTDGLNDGAFERVVLAGGLIGLVRVGGHDDRLKGSLVGL
jgi:hypothetical protein